MAKNPHNHRDERTGFSTTALVVALLAAALLLAMFAFGDWTTSPTRDTALNEQGAPTQTIQPQGTTQPAQQEQPPPPAGGNTSQP